MAACTSEVSQDGGSTAATTAPASSTPTSVTGPSTSGEVTAFTLPGVWVQPTAAPILYFADDRGPTEGPLAVMMTLSADGTPSELWSEMGESTVRMLDVSADGTRVLISRYSYAEGVDVAQLVERELASGVETEIIERAAYFTAEYAIDGSGDIFITNEVDEVADGIVTSSTLSLDRIGPDGSTVANLFTTRESVEGMPWLQLLMDGELVVAIGGAPMTFVGGLGQVMPELSVGSSFCSPVRAAGAALVASCHESDGTYFNQLWRVPLDGTAPEQITQLVDQGSGADFGAGDLWTTTDGRQFVQRYGDCGAAWVEELQADGSTIESDAAGVILGVDGTRLITAANGACDGYWATIAAYDTATGDTTTLLAPPDAGDGHPYGVNAFDILAIAR